MNKLTYYLFRVFTLILKVVPFSLLYLFSKIIYFILYKVVGYRRNVVYSNLKKSFPDKEEKEIREIERAFYKNLSEIMVESVKGYTMNSTEIIKRYKILNPQLLDKYFDSGRNVMGLAAHFANWEWLFEALSALKSGVDAFYYPLTNKYINDFLLRKRAESGVVLVPSEKSRSSFSKKRSKPVFFGMAADQNPSTTKHAVWIEFLNQETACIYGPEFYVRTAKLPLVFLNMQRVSRGYYTLEFMDLGDELWKLPKGEITKLYMKTLEKVIIQTPHLWLWTHKRWKRTRENSSDEGIVLV